MDGNDQLTKFEYKPYVPGPRRFGPAKSQLPKKYKKELGVESFTLEEALIYVLRNRDLWSKLKGTRGRPLKRSGAKALREKAKAYQIKPAQIKKYLAQAGFERVQEERWGPCRIVGGPSKA